MDGEGERAHYFLSKINTELPKSLRQKSNTSNNSFMKMQLKLNQKGFNVEQF